MPPKLKLKPENQMCLAHELYLVISGVHQDAQTRACQDCPSFLLLLQQPSPEPGWERQPHAEPGSHVFLSQGWPRFI